MQPAFDLVVRNGTIVDGTGAPRFEGDVAVRNGLVVEVGTVRGSGVDEIDARDLVVTPGFVDLHTHFDGHATWAERLEPSSQHGVTTVVTGNCGVGFAPCRPRDRGALVRLMEGVEDIPEVVMTTGLPWTWESFGEYLNVIDKRLFDVDLATQIPHAPLRVFTMGQRAIDKEPATADDIAAMRALVHDALDAGALGFSTSRSLNHRASDGTVTYSYGAASDELAGIATGLRSAKAGVLQIISDFDDVEAEFGIVRRMAAESDRPLTLSLIQMPQAPDRWRAVLDLIEQARSEGLDIRAQICGRPIGVLMALDFSRHPLLASASYREVASLEPTARRDALLVPERKARVLRELAASRDRDHSSLTGAFAAMYELGDEPDYEPAREDSLELRAKREGRSPIELAYDVLVERNGVIYIPAANYSGNRLDAIRTMLAHPAGVLGLGDGGAHCGMICDASLPTYMLTRWVESNHGPGDQGRMSLEAVVKSLSAVTASAVGLNDRGQLAPGMRGDLNIIDLDRLRLHRPEPVADLPNGETRIGQQADGYVATIVAGIATRRYGTPTGALPGRLIRGARPRPR